MVVTMGKSKKSSAVEAMNKGDIQGLGVVCILDAVHI